jgi:hypothetical protein
VVLTRKRRLDEDLEEAEEATQAAVLEVRVHRARVFPVSEADALAGRAPAAGDDEHENDEADNGGDLDCSDWAGSALIREWHGQTPAAVALTNELNLAVVADLEAVDNNDRDEEDGDQGASRDGVVPVVEDHAAHGLPRVSLCGRELARRERGWLRTFSIATPDLC